MSAHASPSDTTPMEHALPDASGPKPPRLGPNGNLIVEFELAQESSPISVRLQNVRTNQTLKVSLDEHLPFEKIALEPGFKLPDGFKLDVNSKSLEVACSSAGTYELKFVGFSNPQRFSKISIVLDVIPDPRDLWKNLPSDPNGIFSKPDRVNAAFFGESEIIVGASVRGRSHANVGSYRDDDFAIKPSADNSWTVVAVADGAGSQKYSRRGSQIAVTISTQEAATRLGTLLTSILEKYSKPVNFLDSDSEIITLACDALGTAAYEAWLGIQAEQQKHVDFVSSPKELSTTLILVAWKRFAFGYVFLGLNFGDGLAGVLYEGATKLHALQQTESGQFAGQTSFLSSTYFDEGWKESLRQRITIKVTKDFNMVAVMSDGVSEGKFESEADESNPAAWMQAFKEDWFSEVFETNSKGELILESESAIGTRAEAWLDFWKVGSHDDRTLVIALPKEATS